ncbi:MAG: DUF2752 domain-containing protein, partial [Cyanobacteria bacterium P01_C01_bin.120]
MSKISAAGSKQWRRDLLEREMKFPSPVLCPQNLSLLTVRSSLERLPRLRSPFWRIVTLVTLLSPLLIAVGVGRWGLSLPLPRCLVQWALGFPAPSCGLTRSLLALAAGDWSKALSYHLFGPPIALLALLLAVSMATELITQRSWAHWYGRLARSRPAVAMIGLYVLYYGLRMGVRYGTPSLPWGWGETALWQQFVSGAI